MSGWKTTSTPLLKKHTGLRLLKFLIFILILSSSSCSLRAFASDSLFSELNVNYPFQNVSFDVPSRISNLLSLLTLSEKLTLLYNEIPAIPRLNISNFQYGQECLHGLINRKDDLSIDGAATAFPQSIGLASSWNVSVFSEMGRIISDEARGKRNGRILSNITDPLSRTYLLCWTPVVNILKDPRWGRAGETYGEVPYLTYSYTSHLLAALHGDDIHHIKIAPVLKHFTVYDGPEEGRYGLNVVVGDLDLHDTYNYVYRNLIQAKPSHVRGLMASYSALNGIPVACDFEVMTKSTRFDWGWTDAHIVSDCDAVTGIYQDHHYTPDITTAAALSLMAGMDINCGSGFDHLMDAINQGLITPGDIDATLEHTMNIQFKVGFYDLFGSSPYDKIEPTVVDSASHRKSALDITHQSMVLLKNENSTLPIKLNRIKRIAVIGPSANDTHGYDMCFGGGGSCLLHHIYHAWSSFLIQPLLGIQEYVSSLDGAGDVDVIYADGCQRFGSDTSGFPAAVAAANSSDVIIYIGGLDWSVEEEDTDRSTLQLPSIQQQMLTTLAALKIPIVTVLIHGGAISDDILDSTSAAIVSAFYPGEWAGTAIANILFGKINPSGRMPYTVYQDVSQLPPLGDYNMTDGLGRTFAFFNSTPRYYLGDGLSYTKYLYGPPSIKTGVSIDGYPYIGVNVTVSNIGDMNGSETVQIYAAYDKDFAGLDSKIAPPQLSVPRRMLIGFNKVFVPVGGKVNVELLINVTNLTAFGRWIQPIDRKDTSAKLHLDEEFHLLPLTHEEVKHEIERMRDLRYQLIKLRELNSEHLSFPLLNVTLPVWISVGGLQPTSQRIQEGLVQSQMIMVTAPVDNGSQKR